MHISQEELARRLNSTKNLSTALSKPAPLSPSVEPERPVNPSPKQAVRILSGSLAKQGESAHDIAQEFGLSISQVNRAKHSKDKVVKRGVDHSIERVQELAIDKMMLALGLMDETRMSDVNVKDLSVIAANMGRIIEKTRSADSATQVQLVIYAPEARNQSSYRVVDV